MKIKVEVEDLNHDDLVNFLSGVISYSSYWCSKLDANDAEYDKAKKRLKASGMKEPCLEDIFANMLLQPEELFLEVTEDEDDTVHHLTLEKIKKGIALSFENDLVGLDPDDWDAGDNDIQIQHALFDEVVYG